MSREHNASPSSSPRARSAVRKSTQPPGRTWIGDRLWTLRSQPRPGLPDGMSQARLGELLGQSSGGWVAAVENGRRFPGPESVARLCAIFGVEPSYFRAPQELWRKGPGSTPPPAQDLSLKTQEPSGS